MIRCKYDLESQFDYHASARSKLTGSFSPIRHRKVNGSTYVFERTIPSDRLLDPADLSPNVLLLFEGGMTADQQRRLFRTMEKEARTQMFLRLNSEDAKRRRLEEIRAAEERERAQSELEILRTRYQHVTSRLDAISETRKVTTARGDTVAAEQESQQRQREQQRQQSGRKWALYQEVHMEPSVEDTIQEHESKEEELSPSKIHIGVTASPSPARVEVAPESSAKRTSSGSPSRFERTAEKRARLKALFDQVDESNDSRSKEVSSGQRHLLSPGVAARGAPRPRLVVDL